MNRTTQTEHREKWQVLVEEQEKSGQTQTAFCKQRNLSAAKFSYYRGLSKGKNNPATSENVFSPIKIKKQEIKPQTEIRIVLPNGFQCFLSSAIDATQVKRLMEALLSC